MPKLRVLVVEDSKTVRQRLCEVLAADPEIEIVGEAGDGKTAVECCRALRPDVVTLDMMLPVMSGLAATEYIMAHCPTPILIVSASTNRGELFKTYDALSAGAVDVLEKPRGDDSDDAWAHSFVSTVKLVSRIRVITHPRARLGALGRASAADAKTPGATNDFGDATGKDREVGVVALGASTGGPGALREVLCGIPRLAIPCFVLLHIDDPFGVAFAEWLDDQTPHDVSMAEDGMTLGSIGGKVLVAPSGVHLTIRNRAVRLTSDPPRHSCRPSIDVMFETLAAECGDQAVAALLTGMGRDGAAGLLDVRRAGGRTFAQDEATSVVYGMPREAALLGAAERVLPVSAIGPAIGEYVRLARGGVR